MQLPAACPTSESGSVFSRQEQLSALHRCCLLGSGSVSTGCGSPLSTEKPYRTTHPSKATQDLRSHLDASPRGPHIIPLLRLHAQCPCHSCRLCGRAHGILPLRQTCFSPFFRSNSSDTSNTSVLYALNQRLSFSGIHGIFRRPAPFTVCTHALSPPATEKVLAGVLRPCWGL